ncbi:MAG: class I SAM-dependent methyltransferase [archaeon]
MTENTNFGYWSDVLNDLPDSYKEWFEAEKDFLRANTPQNSRVLEIGCGNGRSLDYIADKGRLYGVDNNPPSVVQARERFNGNPQVSITLDDGRMLPFREDWFDRVMCMVTPVNFGDDREHFYNEMRRVVKPHGEILLSVFNEDEFTFRERMELYKNLGAPIIDVYGSTVVFDYPNGANRSEQFSERQIREILASSNLFPSEITKAGIGYFCRAVK